MFVSRRRRSAGGAREAEADEADGEQGEQRVLEPPEQLPRLGVVVLGRVHERRERVVRERRGEGVGEAEEVGLLVVRTCRILILRGQLSLAPVNRGPHKTAEAALRGA